MKVIVLIFAALWSSVQADIFESIRIIPKRFNNLWKRQDYVGYLTQCSILQFWDKQIGQVNVLAFFDSSWQFSHKQASMLRILNQRFHKTGFDNIQFFAINAAPESTQNIEEAEIELEEETWKQISPSESLELPSAGLSTEALIEQLGPDVYFIQDTEDLQIWPKLKAFRDQILVIDRCGRLTYQVIVPWSILHFPYVKAAILSTYNDEPCGYCQKPLFVTTTNKSDSEPPISDATYDDLSNNFDDQISVETPSTLTVQNTKAPFASEQEASTSMQNEDIGVNSTSEMPETMQIDNNDTLPTSDASTLFYENESDDGLLVFDEFSTTNNISAFEASTQEYDSPTTNYYIGDTSNPTTKEFSDEYSNPTTSTIDFESSTENTKAITIKDSRTIGIQNTNVEEQISPTDTMKYDNDDINYMLQSRSSNARSVLSNGLKNDLEAVEVSSQSSAEEPQSLRSDSLPIRIIMHAPHIDEFSDRTIESHEYIVLKTGFSGYHGHLSGEEADANLSGYEGEAESLKKYETVKRTFGKDESPGLYGEVADYWQTLSNEQIHADSQVNIDSDDQVIDQDSSFVEYDTLTSTSLSLDNDTEGYMESQFEGSAATPMEELKSETIYDNNSGFNDEVDIVDEEAKSKLIAHYSKLLPWLYYVLSK